MLVSVTYRLELPLVRPAILLGEISSDSAVIVGLLFSRTSPGRDFSIVHYSLQVSLNTAVEAF